MAHSTSSFYPMKAVTDVSNVNLYGTVVHQQESASTALSGLQKRSLSIASPQCCKEIAGFENTCQGSEFVLQTANRVPYHSFEQKDGHDGNLERGSSRGVD